MHFFVNNIFFCEIAAKENVKTASYGSVIIIGVGVTAGENFFCPMTMNVDNIK